MKKSNNIPEIRFGGFEGEWEVKRLGDITDFLDEQRRPLASGTRESGKYPYYGASGIIDYVKDYLFDDELILLSEDGANIIDRNYRVCFIAKGKYWVNNHAHVLKSKNNYFNEFVCESLERLNYESYNSGTAQPKLNQEVCRNINIMTPCFTEQSQIGTHFKQLDNLITLKQKKYSKLLNLKKAMLHKMFPQKGATVPEIRFKGFTEEWEEKTLEEMSGITYGGGTPRTSVSEYWSGHIAWIQSSDLKDEVVAKVECRKRITDKAVKSSATKLIPENSIAIVTRVGVGKLALMPFEYATSQDFVSLSKLKIDNWFGVYSIAKRIKTDLNAVQGTSIKGITKDELLSKSIKVPVQFSEQKKIGNYFKKLDHLITLHQKELDKLKNIKKAMLEKMFV